MKMKMITHYDKTLLMSDIEYNKLMKEKKEFLQLVLKLRKENKTEIKEEEYKPTTPLWTFSETPRFHYPYVIIGEKQKF